MMHRYSVFLGRQKSVIRIAVHSMSNVTGVRILDKWVKLAPLKIIYKTKELSFSVVV